ncbi:MAG: methyltransferase domain-containing protein [Dermatophilaceae bacterium]|nr:methyltransferase domain-containing protein [Dermatophilaceae bacterium]
MRTMDTSADLSERRAGVARLFDLLAPHYDQGGVPWFGPIATRLLELVAPAPGERAADIGCGRGAVTLSLAEAVGHDGHVTAVDLSPAMVELLTTRAVELGVGNIETRVGDSSEVGLESGTYDLVTASLVLFFTPDPLDALSHWVSLLRPGGRIGLTAFGDQDPAWTAAEEVLLAFAPPQVLDARTSGRQGSFATTDSLARLLEASGATDVDCHDEPLEVTLPDADAWRAWTMSLGLRQLWASVPEGALSEVLERVGTALEADRGADGLLHLTQQVRYATGTRPG